MALTPSTLLPEALHCDQYTRDTDPNGNAGTHVVHARAKRNTDGDTHRQHRSIGGATARVSSLRLAAHQC